MQTVGISYVSFMRYFGKKLILMVQDIFFFKKTKKKNQVRPKVASREILTSSLALFPRPGVTLAIQQQKWGGGGCAFP